jgi:hypothetical protein
MKKAYLGDSVYVELAHGMLKLTTENGYPTDPSNTIYLEPMVWATLVAFTKRLHADPLVGFYEPEESDVGAGGGTT